MTTEEVVKRIIADELDLRESKVTPDTRLVDDIGADSLDMVELAKRFEEEFSIELPDDEVEEFVTVADVVAYIEKASTENSARKVGLGDGQAGSQVVQ